MTPEERAERVVWKLGDGPVGHGTKQWLRESLAREIREAVAEHLPPSMVDCVIQYKQCPKGHGRLVAMNWVDNGCMKCKLDELQAQCPPEKSLGQIDYDGWLTARGQFATRPWSDLEPSLKEANEAGARAVEAEVRRRCLAAVREVWRLNGFTGNIVEKVETALEEA